MEIANRLTVTRGEGIMGGKVEGFTGTIIKDTWAITSGGGGGNRGGSREG